MKECLNIIFFTSFHVCYHRKRPHALIIFLRRGVLLIFKDTCIFIQNKLERFALFHSKQRLWNEN